MSILIDPYEDPYDTERATTIDMMFDMSPPLSDISIVYNTGVPNSEPVRSFDIFNKTLSTDLQFILNVPDIFIINPSSEFVVPANSHVTMTLTTNEEVLFSLPIGDHPLSIGLIVVPLNVIGPVFIPKITSILVN